MPRTPQEVDESGVLAVVSSSWSFRNVFGFGSREFRLVVRSVDGRALQVFSSPSTAMACT